MGLSLVQRFGTGTTIDTTTPSNPKLVIPLKALQSSTNNGDITGNLGINDSTTLTSSDADKIAAALIRLWVQNQPSEDTNPTIGVYVDPYYRTFETRTGVEQKAYNYTLRVYTLDDGGDYDLDDVVVA